MIDTEKLLASERSVREAEAEIACLREALAPFANHQEERLRCRETGTAKYSALTDSQWRRALDAYTATEFSVELTWESISPALSLLQDGLISRRKAHEAINEVLAGDTPDLPTAGEAEFGQDEMPGEVLRGLRATLAARDARIAKLEAAIKTILHHAYAESGPDVLVRRLGIIAAEEVFVPKEAPMPDTPSPLDPTEQMCGTCRHARFGLESRVVVGECCWMVQYAGPLPNTVRAASTPVGVLDMGCPCWEAKA